MKKTVVLLITLGGMVPLLAGCQMLSYRTANGENFTRAVLGTRTALSAMTIDLGSNGVRRVEIRRNQKDAQQALGTVTEAVVRAALQPVH